MKWPVLLHTLGTAATAAAFSGGCHASHGSAQGKLCAHQLVTARCPPTSRRMPWHIKLADGAPFKEEQEELLVVDAPVDTKLNEAQLEVLRGVQDPFHALRLVIFAVFAIVGLAGVVVSVAQLPSNPAEVGNVVVNGFVLAVGCAAFVFDQRVQSQLKRKLENELANPYLKGGSEFYFKEREEPR